MKPLFDAIQITKPNTNVFDLSHEKKMSLNMGKLYPILCQEVVPGDKFKVNTEIMMRLAPMVAPMMHRVNVFTHYFFVPNRLVYEDWEKFITGGDTGIDNPAFPVLSIQDGNKAEFAKGSLADYFGIPVTGAGTVVNNQQVNALPFRAYQLIYNEYYRDQNIMPKVAITKNSTVAGAEHPVLTQIRSRCWEKDYFTSCLPWSQKGGEVLVPIQNGFAYKAVSQVKDSNGIPINTTSNLETVLGSSPHGTTFSAGVPVRVENIDNLETEVTINELRRATRLQQWLEKNARAGSRYIEQMLAHFGVRSSDARLQRPEYLGGGKSPVVVSEVLQTSATDGTSPQGNMTGHGLSVGSTHTFKKYFEEHGFIIGIMSVLPRTAYQQGLHRMWSRDDKFDYFWPEFANLGEQEVLNREVFMPYEDAGSIPGNVFGYQSRYSEYKFGQDSVHGDFRDNMAFWHMGRKFTSLPTLSSEFLTADPTHRVFAVDNPAFDKLYCQVYHNIKAVRPMPIFGTPMF